MMRKNMTESDEKQKLPWVYCALTRFLYGYIPSIIISIILYTIHWKYQTATSHDSFTGFALFYVAPIYFAVVGIGNAWVLFIPTMNKILIFLASLVIPVGFFFI